MWAKACNGTVGDEELPHRFGWQNVLQWSSAMAVGPAQFWNGFQSRDALKPSRAPSWSKLISRWSLASPTIEKIHWCFELFFIAVPVRQSLFRRLVEEGKMATYPRPASRHRILFERGLVLPAGQFPETNSSRSFELKSRHTPLHYFLDFFPGIMGCAVAISCYIPHVQKIEVTLPYLGVHSRSPMVDDRLVTYAN